MTVKFYGERDLMALDVAGGYYCRHVSAVTSEELHSKSDIAAELGWRDMQIADLKRKVEALTAENCIQDYIISAAKELIGESSGVAGWHLNGAIASWDEALPEINHSETPATDAALAEIRAQVWVEAKFYAKSMIESDACEFVDFLFDSKVQQLRGEAGL